MTDRESFIAALTEEETAAEREVWRGLPCAVTRKSCVFSNAGRCVNCRRHRHPQLASSGSNALTVRI